MLLNILVIIALTTGCATQKATPKLTLTTHIYLDGTKRFEFIRIEQGKLSKKIPAARGGEKGEDLSRSHRRKDKKRKEHSGGPHHDPTILAEDSPQAQKALNQAQLALTETLNRNGYCREGYLTMNERISKHGVAILGQCIEQATEEDKILFPNTRTISVEEEDISSD